MLSTSEIKELLFNGFLTANNAIDTDINACEYTVFIDYGIKVSVKVEHVED